MEARPLIADARTPLITTARRSRLHVQTDSLESMFSNRSDIHANGIARKSCEQVQSEEEAREGRREKRRRRMFAAALRLFAASVSSSSSLTDNGAMATSRTTTSQRRRYKNKFLPATLHLYTLLFMAVTDMLVLTCACPLELLGENNKSPTSRVDTKADVDYR